MAGKEEEEGERPTFFAFSMVSSLMVSLSVFIRQRTATLLLCRVFK